MKLIAVSSLEKLLYEYLGGHNNRKALSPAGMIKMIENKDLGTRLNKARNQRNMLAHNIDKDIKFKDLLSENDLKNLYHDLEEYFRLKFHHI